MVGPPAGAQSPEDHACGMLSSPGPGPACPALLPSSLQMRCPEQGLRTEMACGMASMQVREAECLDKGALPSGLSPPPHHHGRDDSGAGGLSAELARPLGSRAQTGQTRLPGAARLVLRQTPFLSQSGSPLGGGWETPTLCPPPTPACSLLSWHVIPGRLLFKIN